MAGKGSKYRCAHPGEYSGGRIIAASLFFLVRWKRTACTRDEKKRSRRCFLARAGFGSLDLVAVASGFQIFNEGRPNRGVNLVLVVYIGVGVVVEEERAWPWSRGVAVAGLKRIGGGMR
jgi:hypothetical protein